MRVWLFKDGENLPVQEGARPMRMWRLARELVARGHTVVWWASTFSHQRKQLLSNQDHDFEIEDGFTLRLLASGTYHKNVSVDRYLHHRRLAKKFKEVAPRDIEPDVIVAAFPQIDFAFEAVRFGKSRNIPVVVDIRDPWPDVYIDKGPKFLRWLAPVLLRGAYAKTRFLLSAADQWVAVSIGFERWARDLIGNSQIPSRVLYIGNERNRLKLQDVEPSTLEPLGAQNEGRIIFSFVGSFGHSYDLETVFEAARLCHDRGLDKVYFVIAGDGEKRAILSRLGQGLPNLLMPGWLSSQDLDYLLKHSHVGLVPCISRPDTVPNKVFEYLAAGLPLLSSLVGEVEEILLRTEAGFSYQVGDIEGLYNLVQRLVAAPDLLDRLSRNARILFEQDFVANHIYAEYAVLIENLTTAGTTTTEVIGQFDGTAHL